MATRKLSTYRGKRDFTQTAEPSGTLPVRSSTQLRFVIQKHAARRLHYDVRLELGGVFKPWAVTRGPSLTQWVKPQLVAEIEFAGWTASGNVRQAAFKGLRAKTSLRGKSLRSARPARRTPK